MDQLSSQNISVHTKPVQSSDSSNKVYLQQDGHSLNNADKWIQIVWQFGHFVLLSFVSHSLSPDTDTAEPETSWLCLYQIFPVQSFVWEVDHGTAQTPKLCPSQPTNLSGAMTPFKLHIKKIGKQSGRNVDL